MHRNIAAFLIAGALLFFSAPAYADEPDTRPGEVQPTESDDSPPTEEADDRPPAEPDDSGPTEQNDDSDEPADEEEQAESESTDDDEPPADAPEQAEPESGGAEPEDGPGVQPREEPTPSISLPEDPDARLVMARKAFRRTDYGLLVPLLQPLVGPDSPLERLEDRIAARELLAVGYFFMAQQETNPDVREDLLDNARDVFLELLREKPDHALDNLIFPVSVVELFEAVRRENAEELQRLQEQHEVNTNGEMETLYIERASTKGVWWLNLLPFGVGQFQNEQVAKATAFAILQGGALALNAGSYFAVLSLINDNGRFDTEGGNDSDFAKALRWRRNLYIGLGSFAGLWVLSAIDGLLNFEKEKVRIRTLDAPPPELGGVTTGTGTREPLPLGLSFEFDW